MHLSEKTALSKDIFIAGHVRSSFTECESLSAVLQASRNRAIHGDLVVAELLPEEQWESPSYIVRNWDEEADGDAGAKKSSNRYPTGRIVGVLMRNQRTLVAVIQPAEGTAAKMDKQIFVPMDYRLPKVRIVTRQADALKDVRVALRIDNWPVDSMHPNGHYLRTLGEIGKVRYTPVLLCIHTLP